MTALLESPPNHVSGPDYFFFKNKEDGHTIKLFYNEIILIESDRCYIKLFTTKGDYITLMRIKKMAEVLSNRSDFMRVHHSYIVSFLYIERIEKNLIKFNKNNLTAKIGDTYLKEVTDFINNKSLNKPSNKAH